MGRRRAQAPRLGRAGRLRDRAEDRRARDQSHLRGRRSRPRRDAGGRDPGRGRDRQPAHDPDRSAADARRRAPGAARGARRGLHAAFGLPGAERTARRHQAEGRPQPTQRGCGLAASEGFVDHRLAPIGRLGLRRRRMRRAGAGVPLGHAPAAARARFPDEPVRRAPRVARVGGGGVPHMGEPPRGAGLRDRRDRDQGRFPRPAAAGSALCTGARAGRGRSSGPR